MACFSLRLNSSNVTSAFQGFCKLICDTSVEKKRPGLRIYPHDAYKTREIKPESEEQSACKSQWLAACSPVLSFIYHPFHLPMLYLKLWGFVLSVWFSPDYSGQQWKVLVAWMFICCICPQDARFSLEPVSIPKSTPDAKTDLTITEKADTTVVSDGVRNRSCGRVNVSDVYVQA